MSRKNVLHGCQLRVRCSGEVEHELLEKHHLIPTSWSEKHPEAVSKIKGGRELTLFLCPNCHAWIHLEMRKRLGNDPSEEGMWRFVDEIWQRKYY